MYEKNAGKFRLHSKKKIMLVVQNPDKNVFTTKVQLTGLEDNLRLSNIILNLLLIVAE